MSDLGVGDAEVATLLVEPADNSTVATLALEKPDGSSTPIAVSGGALEAISDTSPVAYRQTWTSDQAVTYDQAGRPVLHWTVTGTGQGTEDLEVFVVASPVAGGPTWTPGRSRVANYVTHRTLARSTASIINSQDTYELTFDSTTTPTGLQTDRLIADGVAWVSMRASPLAAASYDVAAVVVSLYAAAAIERQFPADEDSLQRANDLEKRMDVLLKDLVAANNASNGTDDYGLEVAPMWAFPAPDCRWDSPNYW